jgi:hypothetical protein
LLLPFSQCTHCIMFFKTIPDGLFQRNDIKPDSFNILK